MASLLTLGDILEALTGKRSDLSQLTITETEIDSRKVIPGAMFVALPGENVDGHDYVQDAFQRGANLAIIQRELPAEIPQIDLRSESSLAKLEIPSKPFCLLVNDSLKAMQTIAGFWRRRLDVRVIGITGSVGKSTTKELVAEVLSTRYTTLRNIGNLNNEIGLPLSLLRLSGGYQRAVLEMGFYVPGEITFLCELALPQVGIVTNVGTVHAERAGSQEMIARGKTELVQALPAAPNGTAILNYDDSWVLGMRSSTSANVLTYGLSPEADLWAGNIESLGLHGIEFDIHYQKDTLHLHVPLIGQHSVQTVLRAAAAGLTEGLTWTEIAAGLQENHSQLRLVAVHSQKGALLLDDTYNASPESTMAALNLLHEIEGRKIAVLGDMLELGPYEKQGHEKVGIRVAEVANFLVAVGQKGKMIAEAAQKAGMPARSIQWFADVPPAIEFLQQLLEEKDVALIKGSHGLRMDRIVSALEVES